MHRIFQTFIDRLAESADAAALRTGMAETATAFDLHVLEQYKRIFAP